MSETISDGAGQTRTRLRRAALGALVVLLALLYAYDLWEAVASLVEYPQQIGALNDQLGTDFPVPWTALIAGVAAPVLLFAAALLLGRRRSALPRIALLLLGLCVQAVVSLDLIAYVGAGGL